MAKRENCSAASSVYRNQVGVPTGDQSPDCKPEVRLTTSLAKAAVIRTNKSVVLASFLDLGKSLLEIEESLSVEILHTKTKTERNFENPLIRLSR